jgi:hypothetical protein
VLVAVVVSIVVVSAFAIPTLLGSRATRRLARRVRRVVTGAPPTKRRRIRTSA